MRKGSRPLYRVKAVVGLMLEWVPLAFGLVSSAHVLNHDHVTPRCRRVPEVRGILPVVGSPLKQNGKFAFSGRTINVGIERNTVACLHRDVMLDGDAGDRLADSRSTRKQNSGSGKRAKKFLQHERVSWGAKIPSRL